MVHSPTWTHRDLVDAIVEEPGSGPVASNATNPAPHSLARSVSPEEVQNEDSVLLPGTSSNGRISVKGTLRIGGEFRGVICASEVYISDGADIDAHLEADRVVVAGTVSGILVCNGRVEVQSTGRFNGHIDTRTLVVHQGAVIGGTLQMGNDKSSQDLAQHPSIARLGKAVYTPRGLHLFLTIPSERFGGRTALDLMREGDEQTVLSALASDYEAIS